MNPSTAPSQPAAAGDKPVTPDRVMQYTWAFAPTCMLDAGVRNGIFDALDAGPKSAPAVAAATKCSLRGVRGLLEGLAGFGLLLRDGDKFTLAPDAAAFLVSSKPGFLGGLIRHMTGQLMESWLHLHETVKTGKPSLAVNRQKGGAEFFEQFVEDLFNLNFAGASALAHELAKTLGGVATPFTVLDIAAGSGVWSIPLVKLLPNAQAVVVDFPQVTPVTKRVYERHGLGSRIRAIDGDIATADFGTGHRVAFLGHILHSEGEARSRKLIGKVFNALAPGGQIAIAEFVLADDRSGPPMPLVFALNMLVNTDEGDAYTYAQMAQWLGEAGFTNVRQLAVPAPSPILLATRPQ